MITLFGKNCSFEEKNSNVTKHHSFSKALNKITLIFLNPKIETWEKIGVSRKSKFCKKNPNFGNKKVEVLNKIQSFEEDKIFHNKKYCRFKKVKISKKKLKFLK